MIFKFLGSLPFALVLIALTLLFVIAGTFLESWTDSHLFAAHLTYQNPVFQLLLWLYFTNILFSALSRYPFQKKHIPFLITHLGLLLLLLGVFVKNHFGVQGSLALAEGSGSSNILLPNTYALHIESPQSSSLIALKKATLGPIQTNQDVLELTLLEWTPHVQERYEGFIKGNWGHIVGLPPIERDTTLTTDTYEIHTTQTDTIDAIEFPGKPSLFLIQDSEKKEHLVAFNDLGQRYTTSLNGEIYYIYNKGYGGYGVFADLPPHFPPLELIAPLTRTSKALPTPQKREDQTPRIRLAASDGTHSEIVTLTYDRYSQKFKWPILGGKYLVRFQSNRQKIPYHVRLQTAKQINYPETNQPYSYEATVKIDSEEAHLSMNHVYEKGGYRFYLASLIPSATGANQVQIVVNYDPAKYILTYPGAIFLALGIVLLYVRKRYV